MIILFLAVLTVFYFGDMCGDGEFRLTSKINWKYNILAYVSTIAIPFIPVLTKYDLNLSWLLIPLFAVFIGLDILCNLYWKKHNVLKYWYKYLMYLMMFGISYLSLSHIEGFFTSWTLYVAVLLTKKPLSDIFYSMGYRSKGLYIGKENITDKIIRKIGLYKLEKESKFPVLSFLYFWMIVGGFFIALIGIVK